MGWQVGDLAVCVELNPQTPFSLGGLRVGSIYTVTASYLGVSGVHCVDLAEARSSHQSGGYQSFRFRKIRPDEHQACEPEFVTLLKRTKRPVAA
jgi:hypothetical protein